jgi:hypothetical protein
MMRGLIMFTLHQNVITMIKSRRIRWARHVARMGEMKHKHKILFESLEGRNHSEDLGVDGRIILKWILGKQVRRVWSGLMWIRIGTSGWLL